MLVKCWAMLVTGRSAEADENLHGENTGRHSTSVTSFCPHRWNVPIIKPLHGLYHVVLVFLLLLAPVSPESIALLQFHYYLHCHMPLESMDKPLTAHFSYDLWFLLKFSAVFLFISIDI